MGIIHLFRCFFVPAIPQGSAVRADTVAWQRSVESQVGVSLYL